MSVLGKPRPTEWEAFWHTSAAMEKLFSADAEGLGINAVLANSRQLTAHMLTLGDRGAPAVWYNLGFNPELIFALGEVNNICISIAAALCSMLGDSEHTLGFIDAAEAHGVSPDCCSADKAGLGAVIKGIYPEPSCIVGINTPCDSQVASINNLVGLRPKTPTFIIDVPPYDDERTFRHVAGELKELIPFLEKHTGKHLDLKRLKAVCECTNRTSEYLWQWMEWRTAVPVMQPSKTCAVTMAYMISFSGSEWGENIARNLAEEARRKAQQKEVFFAEKARAIWYQDPVWWDIQIYDWMEAELGLTIPMDIFGYYANEGLIDTSSLDSMLYGLARRLVNCHPMSRQFRSSMHRYLADFMHLHKYFHADCGIFAGHVACKHSWAGIGMFREACRNAGIPLLVFEYDMFDPRVLPYEDLQFELRRFVEEVVLPRKKR